MIALFTLFASWNNITVSIAVGKDNGCKDAWKGWGRQRNKKESNVKKIKKKSGAKRRRERKVLSTI